MCTGGPPGVFHSLRARPITTGVKPVAPGQKPDRRNLQAMVATGDGNNMSQLQIS